MMHRFIADHGQLQYKPRAETRFGFTVEPSTMDFSGDLVANGQAESSAFSDGFGGEKGVEDLGLVGERNAGTVVGDRDSNPAVGDDVCSDGDFWSDGVVSLIAQTRLF